MKVTKVSGFIISMDGEDLYKGTSTELSKIIGSHRCDIIKCGNNGNKLKRKYDVRKWISEVEVNQKTLRDDLEDRTPIREKTKNEIYTTSKGVRMILTHDQKGKLLHTKFLESGTKR